MGTYKGLLAKSRKGGFEGASFVPFPSPSLPSSRPRRSSRSKSGSTSSPSLPSIATQQQPPAPPAPSTIKPRSKSRSKSVRSKKQHRQLTGSLLSPVLPIPFLPLCSGFIFALLLFNHLRLFVFVSFLFVCLFFCFCL